MSTVSWISTSVAPCWRARSTSSRAHERAALLDSCRDVEQRLQLVRNHRGRRIGDDRVNEPLVVAEVPRRDRRMTIEAEGAVVQRRDVGRDQFPLAGRQRVGCMEQGVRQGGHRLGRFGAERKQRTDSRGALEEAECGPPGDCTGRIR